MKTQMSVNLSQTSKDPLRHLKRMRNKTPTKTFHKSQPSQQFSNTSILLQSRQVESKLEQTALLKQNCYDPNKYYSNSCEQYLKKIEFGRTKQTASIGSQPKIVEIPSEGIYSNIKQRSKTVQSEDSLKDVLFSKEKQTDKCNQEVQVMTFKKINFTQKSGSEEGKRNTIIERQLRFDEEPNPFDGSSTRQFNEEQNTLKECEVCGRKFNPNSYEKHVRVCQKVFMKKRKQFSSQRQRSRSKQSNKN